MPQTYIDHTLLLHEIEDLVKNYPHKEIEAKGGKIITLLTSSPKSTLKIHIDSKWVGYDFEVDKSVYGRPVGYWLDTDLYALNFNTKVTMEIFNETRSFVENLINHKILVGEKDSVPVIARPIGDDKYEVKICYPTKILHFDQTEYHEVKTRELESLYSLRPIEQFEARPLG